MIPPIDFVEMVPKEHSWIGIIQEYSTHFFAENECVKYTFILCEKGHLSINLVTRKECLSPHNLWLNTLGMSQAIRKMKKYPIIIVTEEYDPHTDIILRLLREMGQDPVRVHTADIPLQTSLSLSYDHARWKNTLQTRTHTIPLDEIRSIWWRRPGLSELSETLTPNEEAFARSELAEATTGMWEMLEHTCYWVSFPANLRRASHKISQLQLADRLGLQIPRTLVSNDSEDVRQFYETCDHQMIYKVLGDPVPYLNNMSITQQIKLMKDEFKREMQTNMEFDGKGLYTTPIREQDLALLHTVRQAPGIFQEYIPKRVELRVTVIGDDIFTAELHSQAHKTTQYDWRKDQADIPMYEHQLPVEIAEQCLALTKAYRLNFSTSDFIVTPDDRYVFLEMNPNGQWLWVQARVPSLHMKEAMAACLIRGSNV